MIILSAAWDATAGTNARAEARGACPGKGGVVLRISQLARELNKGKGSL